MKNYFLIAAIAGTILPYVFFVAFALEEGFNLALFGDQLIGTRPAAGFVADLLISSFAFWPFLFLESRRLQTPSPWIFVILNLTIGLSCAFPLFLYFREGCLEKRT